MKNFTFIRILAIINVFGLPYIGYLIYVYMWQDSIFMTLFIFTLLFRAWLEESVHAVTGKKAVTEFE